MAEYIRGFATGCTITGVTEPILIDFSYKAVGGTTKKLLNNPGTGAAVETKYLTPAYEEMTVRCAYASTTLTSANAVGDALTLSVVSDNSAASTVTVTSGIVQDFTLEGKKGDWEVLSVTTRLNKTP